VLFAFSGSMGVVSLVFLKRIPEGNGGDMAGERAIPWGAMLLPAF
jgi:hypothetical protein